MPGGIELDEALITEVMGTSIVADIGTFGRTCMVKQTVQQQDTKEGNR